MEARVGGIDAIVGTNVRQGRVDQGLSTTEIEDTSSVAFGDAGPTMSNDDFARWLALPDEAVRSSFDVRAVDGELSQRELLRAAP